MTLVDIGVQAARWLLVLFSVVSVGVMIERGLTLRRTRQIEDEDFQSIKASLLKGDVDGARSKAKTSAAPCALALQAGFELEEANPDLAHEAMTQGVEVQCAALQGGLPMLGTIASTAPYVGLFGTVLGILAAFDHIAQSGDTGAAAVAGPISEALTATAMGLGVAIPAVMAYNYFAGRVNVLSLIVETHTLDLAARLPKFKAVTEESHL